MKSSTIAGLVLIVVALVVRPQQTAQPATSSPSMAHQLAVEPIATILKGSPNDAKRLAAYYRQFATVVEQDNGVIQTIEQLRRGHIAAGKLAFPDLQGKYPGLADAIDSVFENQLGLDNVTLTPELRGKAVEVLRAIAWGCENGR